MEIILVTADGDGVAGVVASGKTAAIVAGLGKDVHQLSFPFITPLQSENYTDI